MSSIITTQSSILHLLNKKKTTIIDILLWRAKNQPDRIAYTFLKDGETNEQNLTYSQVLSQVQSVAHRLQKEGLEGERAILLLPSCLEYITAFLGCLYAGVIAVPAFPPDPTRLKVTLPKLQGVINDSQAKVILTNKKIMTFSPLFLNQAPEIKKLKWIEIESVTKGKKTFCESYNISSDDIALLQYTSGSTSSPKGVILTHGNLMHNEMMLKTMTESNELSVGVGWVPLYHNMGLIANLLLPLYVGFHVIITSPVTFLEKPLSWLRIISKYKATITLGPNFAYELCAKKATEADKENLDLTSWKTAGCGSEPIRKSMIDTFSETFASCGFRKEAFTPGYGLAEATLMVVISRGPKYTNLLQAALQNGLIEELKNNEINNEEILEAVCCGKAIDDMEICIVTPDTIELCNDKHIGEIWLSGPSVAQGYWNNPEATKETFGFRLPGSDKTYLRTGDLGFFKNGELYVTGRIKDLIIINGKNYYPQDIEESVIQSHPMIQPDSVAAFAIDGKHTEELVIVAELRNLEAEQTKEKGFLKSRLLQLKSRLLNKNDDKVVTEDILMSIQKKVFEEHNLIANHKVLIKHQTIPKTASNKIQRHACKKQFLENCLAVIESHHVEESQERKIDPPQTPLQEELCGLFREVLNLEKVGINENFFELGGHSLLATQMISRLESTFNVKLSPSQLFEATTVAGLAMVIEESDKSEILPSIVPAEDKRTLSFAQERLWFLDQMEPDNSNYNIPAAIRISGDLNVKILEESFTRIVERHETLRSIFMTEEGKPVQIINEPEAFNIPVIDLTTEEDKETKTKKIAAKEAKTPFNLSTGPLVRAKLIKLKETEHIVVLNMHHIISDGWSMGVLIRELSHIMNSLLIGETPALQPLPIQYADFGAWQRVWLEQGEMEKQLEYWEKQLDDIPSILHLPTDYPRPAIQTYNGSKVDFAIPEDLTNMLKELSGKEGVTLFMTLFSAFNVLLNKLTGENDICVGIPIANRNRKEIEGLIGFFVNTLVLRTKTQDTQTFDGLLNEVRNTTLEAYNHQDIPFEKIVNAISPERDMSYSPIFQVMMALQNMPMQKLKLGDAEINTFDIETETTQFDLILNLEESKNELKGYLKYNTDLFRQDTISRMIKYYLRVLETVVENKHAKIEDIELLDEEEKNKLLLEWNYTKADYPKDKCIHQLFEEQVKKYPDNIAVASEGKELTYKDLNSRANRLAHNLRGKGVKPDSIVSIISDRSFEMIISILAVLKSGGAYLPIDPNIPEERIRFMINDADSGIILTQGNLIERISSIFNNHKQPEILNLNNENIYSLNYSNPENINTSSDLAYVIYTSGSTGIPKGVLIEHKCVFRITNKTNYISIENTDTILQLSNYSFDGSVFDIFGSLLNGAKLLLINKDVVFDIKELTKQIKEHNVTIFFVTTALFNSLVDIDINCFTNIKKVLFGGEIVSVNHAGRAFEFMGKDKIIHVYGPTETTVFATFHNINEIREDSKTIPIGKPVSSTELFIFNPNNQLCPVGVAGELGISGAGLARGYLNRPELTNEKFVTNPCTGEIMYKTGDIARWLPDGNIEYLGRIDTQVKIRGFRIECGEIETALLQHENIKDAVVIAYKEEGRGNILAAYIIFENDKSTINVQTLREMLNKKLPDYMIPSHFIPLNSMPLTPNGKVDRKALPKPDKMLAGSREYVAPQNETEEKLVKIWQELLKVEKIGVNDNFFELGGDSILSIQIISRAKENGIYLTAKDIFMNQTIRELARVAKSRKFIHARQDLITGNVATSPIQRWFFNSNRTDMNQFNQSVLFKVSKKLDIESLETVLNNLINHHDMLRSSYYQEDGQWIQVINEQVPTVKISSADLSGQSEEEQKASIEEITRKLQKSLNINEGKLLVAAHFKMNKTDSDRLFISIHHLVVDGVSWRILIEDMVKSYNSIRENGQISLQEKTTSYEYWTEKLIQYAQTEKLLDEVAYWSDLTYGKEESLIPVNNTSGCNLVSESKTLSISLDEKNTKIFLEEIPGVYHSQVNDLLLTGLLKALTKWTGEENGCWLIDMEGHGREELFEKVDLSRTIGWFTGVYPVLLEKSSGEGTGDLIKRVKENLRRIPKHGIGYGILKYLSDDKLIKDKLSALKSRICFNYLGQFQTIENSSFIEGTDSDSMLLSENEKAERNYELDINAIVTGGKLQINVSYSKDKYEDELIETFLNSIKKSLSEIIEHCINPDAGGYTPSDFPLANILQEELDKLLKDKPTLEDIYPLSPMQQGMLFHTLMDSDSGVYFEHMRFKVEDLKTEEFKKAWELLIKNEPVFRTSFRWEGLKEPLQFVEKEAEFPFEYLDWTDEKDPETQLNLLCEAEMKKGFNLDKAPLMKVIIIKLNSHEYEVIWNFHHILMDGWSLPLVLKKVLEIYSDILCGTEPTYSSSGNYREYISWLRRQDINKAEEYWKKTLADIDGPARLGIEQTNSIKCHQISTDTLIIDEYLSQKLETESKKLGLTLNTWIQGAWGFLLNKYGRNENIVFGVTVSGRNAEVAGIDGVIGLFINTLPLKIDFKEDISVKQYLEKIQTSNVIQREYEYSSLTDIKKWSRISGDLFDNILVFENYPVDESLKQETNIKISSPVVDEKTNYPLTLAVLPGKSIQINFSYDINSYTRESISRLIHHLKTTLEKMLKNPDDTLSSIELVNEEEKHKLLTEWNNTATDYPKDKCIQQLFEEQVEKTPDNIAVVFDEQKMTYRELNDRANQLAHTLRNKGVRNESVVAIITDKSIEMIISILAVMKSGGAYLPIDPKLPDERINFILQDSGAKLILTQQHLMNELSPQILHLLPEERAGWIKPEILNLNGSSIYSVKTFNSERITKPTDLAYIIYTSGSTGLPKGVMIEHSQIGNHIPVLKKRLEIESPLNVSLLASYTFDASLEQIFIPLTTGGKLYIPSEEETMDTDKFWEAMARERINVIDTVPAYMATLLEYDSWKLYTEVLNKYFVIGGDVFSKELLQKLRNCFPDARIYNTYGPTETTINATEYYIEDEIAASTIPIGKPLPGYECYILDENSGLLPAGIPGELCVGGLCVARGYLNRPELTAEKFIVNPFKKGERIYKSGDLVKWLPDGNIEFLGRIDTQVKIRGFRIECGEIEKVLAQNENIKETLVVPYKEPGRENGLVAYIVFKDMENILKLTDLRAILSKQLPDYMIPSYFVQLDELPLNPSGKIDRLALPKPDNSLGDSKEYVAPRNETEATLVKIWQEILKIDKISIYNNFFELGGHSLLATQVISRLREAFNSEISVKAIFEYPTIEKLAEIISRSDKYTVTDIVPVSREGNLSLSYAQERLWFLDQLEPDSAGYNMSGAIRISGELKVKILEQSFSRIIERHETLRTVFQAENGKPVQVIKNPEYFHIPIIDLSSEEEKESIVKEIAVKEANTPFNLSTGPLIRAKLIKVEANEHILVLNMHHIISDGWSMGILIRELGEIINSLIKGDGCVLEPLHVQYADFSVWQRQWMEGGEIERQLGYWKQELSDAPEVLNLPLDYPRPAIQTYNGSTINFTISEALTARINEISRNEGVTLFMTLLSAFNILLHKLTGEKDISIGTPIANRNRREIENLIGFFVNTLVLRNKIDSRESFIKFMKQVKQTTLRAYDHQDTPFEKLVEAISPERNMAYSPLFQVMLTLQNTPVEEINLYNLKITPFEIESDIAKFDLSIDIEEKDDILKASLEYNTDIFKPDTISRIIAYYLRILETIAENREIKIADIELVDEDEKHKLLVEWNDTEIVSTNKYIYQLFEEQVEKTPDNIAVVFDEQKMTYRELNDRANQLAHTLRNKGVRNESVVAIITDKSIEMIISILAVIKSGGAYLPIDPKLPDERINFILQDSGAKLILTQQHLTNKFIQLHPPLAKRDGGINLDIINLNDESVYSSNKSNLDLINKLSDLAYIIYTSGSTGQPKGVMIEHLQLGNHIPVLKKRLSIDAPLNVPLLASYTFDASIEQIFIPLTSGGKLYLPSEDETMDTDKFWKSMAREQINVIDTVPAYMETLLDDNSWKCYSEMVNKYFIIGGDVFSKELATKLRKYFPDALIYNTYGPTETTINATEYELADNVDVRTIPIGKPLPGYQCYVLDSDGKLLPPGVPGELCIGGLCVARGYLNRPELTTEKFIPNPFVTPFLEKGVGGIISSSRLYRTGDLVRWLPDGNIEYLGRIDTQVKIRGFRIECGEIESDLLQHENIKDAVVTAHKEEGKENILVAYIVLKNTENTFTSTDLREMLRKQLPDYMIPSHFVELDKLPLSSSGKVHRKSLPKPAKALGGVNEYVAPRNETEEKLVEIWREILKVEKIGIYDNFFELGGHSLLATQVISKTREIFNVEIPVRAIFESPTTEELARKLIDEYSESNIQIIKDDNLVLLNKGSNNEKHFFLIHAGSGEVEGYLDLGKNLNPEFNYWGIRADRLKNYVPQNLTIEYIATYYIEKIKKVQSEGPYFIAGWCIGGTIAFEIVSQLEKTGEVVRLFTLINSTAPSKDLIRDIISATGNIEFTFESELALIQKFLPEIDIEKLTGVSAFNQFWSLIIEHLEKGNYDINAIGNLLGEDLMRTIPNSERAGIRELIYYFNVIRTFDSARALYTPEKKVKAQVYYFSANEDKIFNRYLWNKYCAQSVKEIEVEGDHFSIFKEPNVSEFARKFNELIITKELE